MPEYEENWREELVRYANLKYSYEGDAKSGYVSHVINNYVIELLQKKCGIEDYKASKEANKEAFINYLKSIDAYYRDENLDKTTIDWYKLYKMLYDECPEFQDYVKSLAIGPEQEPAPLIGLETGVIVRTRPTLGELEQINECFGLHEPDNKNGYTDIYYNCNVTYFE